LSEQISLAGKEASGTGNMKFAMNGALTIGTLDGANIEIRDAVGHDNFFLFGLTAQEVAAHKKQGYDPFAYYHGNQDLRAVLDLIRSGFFSPEKPDTFQPILHSLLGGGDPYMLLADFAAYVACHERVDEVYQDQHRWTEMCVHNIANMGQFSSDRTIREYAREIWKAEPVRVSL
jgi:starch phosphorylase